MSLVGFNARNHPQQVGANGPNEQVDDRGTDQAFFDSLNEKYDFTLDVAAASHNAKCERYYTIEDDGLQQPWSILAGDAPPWGTNESVWCNPPYSDIRPWVEKAWVEWHGKLPDPASRYGWNTFPAHPPPRIVMLLPANRVEQAWWQDLVEPFRDRGSSPLRVEFLRGRMRFDRPDWTPGPKGDRPPFGCCLLIWHSEPNRDLYWHKFDARQAAR